MYNTVIRIHFSFTISTILVLNILSHLNISSIKFYRNAYIAEFMEGKSISSIRITYY